MSSIYAEVITIGDEILYGQITDTNSQWISAELAKVGFKTIRKSSVGDTEEAIKSILAEAEQRASIILITGGLGPTKDDITKKVIAGYFESDLAINEQALADLTEFFKARGRELTELNRMQALQPTKATYIQNKVGTAPGMWFEKEGKVFIAMPGVPFEMKEMMRTEVIPRLTQHFTPPVIYHQFIRTAGIAEAILAEKIERWENRLPDYMKLAYLPSYGGVKLRITATGASRNELRSKIQGEVLKLYELVGEHIFAHDDIELEEAIGRLLTEQRKTIAVAESCTGGYIGHCITRVPGSSVYFKGGVIAYSNEVKVKDLNVNPESIKQHGAVSEQVVREMAERVRLNFKSDIGVATSGIMGPGGATDEKPVGTVWIAYSDAKGTFAKKLQLGTAREVNIQVTAVNVLNLVRRALEGLPKQ